VSFVIFTGTVRVSRVSRLSKIRIGIRVVIRVSVKIKVSLVWLPVNSSHHKLVTRSIHHSQVVTTPPRHKVNSS